MTAVAAIPGTGETPYTRHPPPGLRTEAVLLDAAQRALRDAGLEPRAVDGLALASFTLRPDHAIDLAWKLGLQVRWLMEDTNGGASRLNMLHHARRAIETGDASAILILGGDVFSAAEYLRRGGAAVSKLVLISGPIKLTQTPEFPWTMTKELLDAVLADIENYWPAREREFTSRYFREPALRGRAC
jgi:acetyl-CoA acetyltransferase